MRASSYDTIDTTKTTTSRASIGTSTSDSPTETTQDDDNADDDINEYNNNKEQQQHHQHHHRQQLRRPSSLKKKNRRESWTRKTKHTSKTKNYNNNTVGIYDILMFEKDDYDHLLQMNLSSRSFHIR